MFHQYRITDRHELRLFQTADAEELFAVTDANRAYLRQWLPWVDGARSVADSRSYIDASLQQFAENSGFVAAICYDEKIVGTIGFNEINWHSRIGYIGYWLAESHRGQGLATASCRSIIECGFQILDLNRMVIACGVENKRSQAIPQRLGFTHEGTARQAEWLYDHFVDHQIYSLLRSDVEDSQSNN
jgi:ribosomal-protein-serine acetyltransferase